MLRNIFDFGLANRFDFSGENEFVKKMKSEYDIIVIETLHERGRHEDNIRIWIDIPRNEKTSSCLALLYDVIKNNGNGISLNSDCFGPEIQIISQKIVDLYMFCLFGKKSLNNTNIYIYDFCKKVKEYAFGHSIRNIQDILYENYQIERRRVLCFYEPSITVICETDVQLTRLLQIQDAINEICCNEIKKYDHYGVVKCEDIIVNILLRSELETNKQNDIAIEQSLRS